MDQQKKPVITTGNIDGHRPILASESQGMAEVLKPSPPSTSIAPSNTKPVSLREALSLLQTICFDLQAQGCKISILARNDRFYVIGTLPSDTGTVSVENGHIAIDGKPVSEE